MFKLTRRTLVLGLLSAVTFIGALYTTAANAGDWEHRPDLGGYLDLDTGLVWGERGVGLGSWDYISNTYIPNLRSRTGLPWRFPTVAESQLAASHGITSTVTISGTCWTSDAKNKGGARTAHYAVNMFSGEANLFNNGSLIHFVPVYRAFTP